MDAQSELGMKKADMFWMRYPDRRFTASMEFVMDISLKVQLRGGPTPLAPSKAGAWSPAIGGEGGIALLGVPILCF